MTFQTLFISSLPTSNGGALRAPSGSGSRSTEPDAETKERLKSLNFVKAHHAPFQQGSGCVGAFVVTQLFASPPAPKPELHFSFTLISSSTNSLATSTKAEYFADNSWSSAQAVPLRKGPKGDLRHVGRALSCLAPSLYKSSMFSQMKMIPNQSLK